MLQQSALELAGEVTRVLKEVGEEPLLIGAIALAVHGYVRGTEDVDLALAVEPQRLVRLATLLSEQIPGADVTVTTPEADDPLGGVIDIRRGGEAGDVVQVVNFERRGGGFPAVVRNALTEPFTFPGGVEGAVVVPEDLVLFKLYAGGLRNHGDIQELLVRTHVDRARLEALAERYGLMRELREVLGKADG